MVDTREAHQAVSYSYSAEDYAIPNRGDKGYSYVYIEDRDDNERREHKGMFKIKHVRPGDPAELMPCLTNECRACSMYCEHVAFAGSYRRTDVADHKTLLVIPAVVVLTCQDPPVSFPLEGCASQLSKDER